GAVPGDVLWQQGLHAGQGLLLETGAGRPEGEPVADPAIEVPQAGHDAQRPRQQGRCPDGPASGRPARGADGRMTTQPPARPNTARAVPRPRRVHLALDSAPGGDPADHVRPTARAAGPSTAMLSASAWLLVLQPSLPTKKFTTAGFLANLLAVLAVRRELAAE